MDCFIRYIYSGTEVNLILQKRPDAGESPAKNVLVNVCFVRTNKKSLKECGDNFKTVVFGFCWTPVFNP